MGLCYSLRPRLFGDAGGGGSISSAGAASEPEAPAEPHAAPQPQPLGVPLRPGGKPGGEADGPPLLLLQNGGGGNGAAPERQPALAKAGGPGLGSGGKAARQQALHQPPALQRTWEKLRLEEREAEKEARKVSKSIDRALKEQKREYKQTHRLLLLGTCVCVCLSVCAGVCRGGQVPRGAPRQRPLPGFPCFPWAPSIPPLSPRCPPPGRVRPRALPQTGLHLLFPPSSPVVSPRSWPWQRFCNGEHDGRLPGEGERLHPGGRAGAMRMGSSGVCPGAGALPGRGLPHRPPRELRSAPAHLGNMDPKKKKKENNSIF